jgi:copper(I)-binding protein
MKLLVRTWVTAMLLVATIGLCACDISTEATENAVPFTTPAAMSAVGKTAAEVITVSNPRIRATAPGHMVSGAFMTLTNTSATPHALTSASFIAAGTVEIHETSMSGEMMRMRA